MYLKMKLYNNILKMGGSMSKSEINSNFINACKKGDIEEVKLWIKKGANDYNRGLSCACQCGHIDIVNLMIEKGANYCYWCKNKKHNFNKKEKIVLINDSTNVTLCISCNEVKPNYVLIPCGHPHMCENCHKKRKNDKCSICKEKIEKYQIIYL